MSESSSSAERVALLSNQHRRRRYCLQSKSAILIISWTLFIGVAFATFLNVTSLIIVNNYSKSKVDNVVTYSLSLLYVALAIVYILYPLVGFVADVFCGRFKVVIFCFGLVLFSYLAAYFCGIAYLIIAKHTNNSHLVAPPAISAIFAIAAILSFIGFGGFQVNFIQLGLDQQISAPSEHLALFIHWTIWAYNFGCTINTIFLPLGCLTVSTTAKIAILSFPILIVAFYLFVFVFSCLNHQWFNSELRLHNPCKTITNVLCFARKHKYPIFRSSFTFSDDEKPSRLDFAKEKFGGPFTTEQVEDTKSFFKVLLVLLALGPVFTMDVISSYLGLYIFGYHAGSVNVSNGLLDHCSSWVLVWSGSLKYISGTLFFPIYIWYIFSYLRTRIPRIFVRLFAGIILYLLGDLSLLVIDLIGHLLYTKHDSNSGELGSMCMFDYRKSFSRHLHMHWAVMVPPSILLGIGPLVVMTSTLEFISAQTPHFMKGLIIGIMFMIVGLFQLIGALALLPFSVKEIWSTTPFIQNPPITNCGFGYLLFTFTVAFIGLILFMLVARKYTYRVRDDKPYDQSQVEEIFSRYLERPVRSYDS